MRKREDLTNRIFGRLTAKEYTNKRWLCECLCGNRKLVRAGDLKSGDIVSCGCFHKDKMKEIRCKDITGNVFGKLTVIENAGMRNKASYWKCLCSCGEETIVRQGHLSSGNVKSCGCLGRSSRRYSNVDISNSDRYSGGKLKPAVYQLMCIPTGKFYIGSSKNYENRWYNHKQKLANGNHENPLLQRAWNKYGQDAFLFTILENIESVSLLFDREQYWLDYTKAYNRKIGFNISKFSYRPCIDIKKSENKRIRRLEKILATYTPDNLPSNSSLNEYERKDAIWISMMRQAKSGSADLYWHPILETMAAKAGFPNIFSHVDHEQEARKKAESIFQKYSPDNPPRGKSKNKEEDRDAHWIYDMRQVKRRHLRNEPKPLRACGGSSNWYPFLDEIADKYGFHGIFDIIDREAEVVKRAKSIFSKYTPKTLPTHHDKDEQKRRDGYWITDIRTAKKDSERNIFGKGVRKWYPILDDIANEFGFNGIFDTAPWFGTKEHEFKMKTRLENVLRRAIANGLPSYHNKDKQTNDDANFIHRLRSIKQNRNCKHGEIWYPSLDLIARKYGFANLFDLNKKIMSKNHDINILHEIIAKYTPNQIPLTCGKNKEEVRHARWIQRKRQARYGGTGYWHPEIGEIAAENGFAGLFDRKNKCPAMSKEQLKNQT